MPCLRLANNKVFWLCIAFILVGAWHPKGSNTSNEIQSQSYTQLRIATWNIQMLPNDLALFSKHLRKQQSKRTPWIIQYCLEQDFEVIVFQEVFDRGILRRLKRDLIPLYPYQMDPIFSRGQPLSNGLFIVSRYPIQYLDHIVFPKGVHADRWAAKGCTLIELEKEDLQLQIAVTHLQAENSEAAIAHRDHQYKQINTLLSRNYVDSIPVLLAGDFNTRRADRENFQQMLETLNVTDFLLQDSSPFTIDQLNYWNPGAESMQLDYIFLQKRNTSSEFLRQTIFRPIHPFKKGRMDLADHYGIVADVQLSN